MKPSLLLILVFISFNSRTQFFSKKIDTPTVYDVTNFDLQATDSNYLFCSTEIQLSNNFHRLISLIKTNLNGEIVSSFKYETNDSQYSISCKSIVTLTDGNMLISALFSENNTFPISPVLILLDATGNVTWSRELNLHCSTEGIHIQKLSDNSILGIVNDNDATLHPILFKIDNNGAVLSPMELSNTPFGVTHIIPNSTNFDLLFTDGNLLTIENDLSSIHSQTKYYHQSGMNFGKTSNGDYIIVASQVFGPGFDY